MIVAFTQNGDCGEEELNAYMVNIGKGLKKLT